MPIAAAAQWKAAEMAYNAFNPMVELDVTLAYATADDTFRLVRQGIERGSRIIRFSVGIESVANILEHLPENKRTAFRIERGAGGQLGSTVVSMFCPGQSTPIGMQELDLTAPVRISL